MAATIPLGPRVKVRIRGFSAGSYTAAIIAKTLQDPLNGHDAHIDIEEVLLGALNFPPRVYLWLLATPNVLLIQAAQGQLSKVSITHLEEAAAESRATDRLLTINIDSQARAAGFGNHGYSGILGIPRCALPRRLY